MNLTRSHRIESILNRYPLENGIGVGDLLGHYLYLELKRKDIFRQLLSSVRLWLFPRKYTLKIYKPINASGSTSGISVLCGLIIFQYRYLRYFEKIINDPHYDCSLVAGQRELGESQIRKYKVLRRSAPLKQQINILMSGNLTLFEKIICLGGFRLQWMLFKTWVDIITSSNFRIVICDLDRYSSNVPLVIACRKLGIPTVSLIHGTTTPPFSYVPVIANHLFTWGQFHVDQFRNVNPTSPQIHVVGNPTVSEYRSLDGHQGVRTIGLGTTKLPIRLKKKLLSSFLNATNHFCARIIKIHPGEELSEYQKLTRGINNLKIITSEVSVHDFFDSIDVLCVRNSQLGSDALSMNIPIIILDCADGWNLHNGETLHNRAGCPLVQGEIDLQQVLSQLEDPNYYHQRLAEQKKYFHYLYSFTGEAASRKMVEAINKIVES